MSLSLQKNQPIKNKSLNKQEDVFPCPECGQIAMKHIRGTCRLGDGNVIRDLKRFQCDSCKTNFFDDAAMEIIESYRNTS